MLRFALFLTVGLLAWAVPATAQLKVPAADGLRQDDRDASAPVLLPPLPADRYRGQSDQPDHLWQAEESEISFGKVFAGAAAGWGAGMILLAPLEPGAGVIGATLAVGPGAHWANNGRGWWPAAVLAPLVIGAGALLPAMEACWEGCDRGTGAIVISSIAIAQILGATFAERATD